MRPFYKSESIRLKIVQVNLGIEVSPKRFKISSNYIQN